jgi:maltose-binding protein MalE
LTSLTWKSLIPAVLLSLAACGGTSAPASSPASAAGASPKAGTSAAASTAGGGFITAASHDDIVAKAKAEGSLKALSTADPKTIKAFKDGFSKKYPFINFDIEEQTGTEAQQRFQLELKAGQAKDWDVLNMAEEV